MAESYTADTLAPLGLTLDMWRVLAALSNNGEQRQIDLVEHDLDRRLDHVAAGDAAGAAGAGDARRSKTSNREVVVELSAKGRAQVERLIPIAKGLEGIASSGPLGQGAGGGETRAEADVRKSHRRPPQIALLTRHPGARHQRVC